MTWFFETTISDRRLGSRSFTCKALRMGGWTGLEGKDTIRGVYSGIRPLSISWSAIAIVQGIKRRFLTNVSHLNLAKD